MYTLLINLKFILNDNISFPVDFNSTWMYGHTCLMATIFFQRKSNKKDFKRL